MHEEVFEARELRLVGCCRADPINVDDETATDEKVPVLFAPGRNARSVADLTVAFVLNLARNIIPMHQRLCAGDFDPGDLKAVIDEFGGARGFELASATVGLLGFGAVARATARRLRAFDATIIASDPHVSDEVFAALEVERVELDALFARADVLSLHAPASRETRGIVSRERIASMKDGVLLVNTARHALLDEEAVLDALRQKKIAAAALDVFKVEPPLKTDPFLALPNVIATPHIGGATRDVVVHQSRIIAADVDRVLCGETPRHCVNPEVLS